ncbi:MAG: hypothetical protein WA802_06860 [Terracidiphilus sp.]
MSLLFEALRRVEDERTSIGSPPAPDAAELLRCVEGTDVSIRETPAKVPGDPGRIREAPVSAAPSSAVLAGSQAGSGEEHPLKHLSGVKRTMSALQTALPIVESILLLFDRKRFPAVSRPSIPQQLAPPVAPPPPPGDLALIELSLSRLSVQNRELRDQFIQLDASVKHAGDHLERVREATDRNTLQQQELIEDLKSFGGKVKIVSLLAIGLLAISVAINLVFYLHFLKVGR